MAPRHYAHRGHRPAHPATATGHPQLHPPPGCGHSPPARRPPSGPARISASAGSSATTTRRPSRPRRSRLQAAGPPPIHHPAATWASVARRDRAMASRPVSRPGRRQAWQAPRLSRRPAQAGPASRTNGPASVDKGDATTVSWADTSGCSVSACTSPREVGPTRAQRSPACVRVAQQHRVRSRPRAGPVWATVIRRAGWASDADQCSPRSHTYR
jgi:hypothetical protein